MVLILDPVTTEVKNINRIGKMLIANKNTNLLSLRSNLNLIFFIKSQTKIKNGISNPTCFIKKISGNLI
jgi:hypothetical protein